MPCVSNCRAELYRKMDALRRAWGIADPFDPFLIACTLPGVEVCEREFSTPGLHGMIITSSDKAHAMILLDRRRSEIEQTFDLSHELVHFALHPPTDRPRPVSSFREWQANEGAAELLLPRSFLLQFLSRARTRIQSPGDADRIVQLLSERQGITRSVVRFRMLSLGWDISYALEGADPETLPILPNHAHSGALSPRAFWFFPNGQYERHVI